MDVGELDTRIVIEQRTKDKDDAGQPKEVWAQVCRTWAQVRMATGVESIRNDADMSVTRGVIRIRKRTNLNAGMRVRINNATFDITAIPYVGRVWYMELIVEAIHGTQL